METPTELNAIHSHIESMKVIAEKLALLGADFPALDRNLRRILASLKMLELNVSDLVE